MWCWRASRFQRHQICRNHLPRSKGTTIFEKYSRSERPRSRLQPWYPQGFLKNSHWLRRFGDVGWQIFAPISWPISPILTYLPWLVKSWRHDEEFLMLRIWFLSWGLELRGKLSMKLLKSQSHTLICRSTVRTLRLIKTIEAFFKPWVISVETMHCLPTCVPEMGRNDSWNSRVFSVFVPWATTALCVRCISCGAWEHQDSKDTKFVKNADLDQKLRPFLSEIAPVWGAQKTDFSLEIFRIL